MYVLPHFLLHSRGIQRTVLFNVFFGTLEILLMGKQCTFRDMTFYKTVLG